MDISKWKKFIADAISAHPEAEIVFKKADQDAQEKIDHFHDLSAKQAVWGGQMDALAHSEAELDSAFAKLEVSLDNYYQKEEFDKPKQTIFDVHRQAEIEANTPRHIMSMDEITDRFQAEERKSDPNVFTKDKVMSNDLKPEIKQEPISGFKKKSDYQQILAVAFAETRDEIVQEKDIEIEVDQEPSKDNDLDRD